MLVFTVLPMLKGPESPISQNSLFWLDPIDKALYNFLDPRDTLPLPMGSLNAPPRQDLGKLKFVWANS